MFNPLAWWRHRRAMKQFAALLEKYAATPAVVWCGVDYAETGVQCAWCPSDTQTHTFDARQHKWYVLCQGGEGYSASYHRTRAEARAARKKMQANPFMQWDTITVYEI